MSLTVKVFIDRVNALLKKIEWVGGNCPCCGAQFRHVRHEEGCELKALLDALNEEYEARG